MKKSAINRQRGSIIIPVAVSLLVGLILLGGVQLGYYFHLKRELQNTADLAALSGVQLLRESCADAKNAAKESADQNYVHGTLTLNDELKIECGVWDNSIAPDKFNSYFSINEVENNPLMNALRVRITKKVLPFMPFSDAATISVEAQAANSDPVAAFSIGSRLLSLDNNGLLGLLLKTVGLDPSVLTVLDSEGLANLQVTPSGLLQALGLPPTVLLGVGTPDQLAQVKELTIGQLLNATVTAVSKAETAELGVGLLNDFIDLVVDTDDLFKTPIQLLRFPDEVGNALLELGHGKDLSSALNANLNVVNLLTTGLAIANGENMLDLDVATPLLGEVVDVKLRIVEPPSIAIGGVGTTANSAGIRVYIRLNTAGIPVVGKLLSLVLKVDLPIILEVAQSDGELINVCSPKKNQAKIAVTSSVLNVCVGKFPDEDSVEGFFSTTNSCKKEAFTSVERYEIFNLLGVLPLTAKVALSVVDSDPDNRESVVLNAPPAAPSKRTVNFTDLDLARTVTNVTDALIGGLLGDLLGDHTVSGVKDKDRKNLAEKLVVVDSGNYDKDKSVSKVFAEMKWSQEYLKELNKRISNNGLTGFLGGTLTAVGNVLGTILGAPLADLGCGLAAIGGEDKQRECRVDAVKRLALSDNGLVGGLAAILIDVLKPVLDILSAIVSQLLNLLGLSLGETDIELFDVQCGVPRLVY